MTYVVDRCNPLLLHKFEIVPVALSQALGELVIHAISSSEKITKIGRIGKKTGKNDRIFVSRQAIVRKTTEGTQTEKVIFGRLGSWRRRHRRTSSVFPPRKIGRSAIYSAQFCQRNAW
ncbi:uncharacterized protein LOC112906813 [Agrilus planipennis]|uniref:Uncharacterized protein LOC112906813 n=1 Tax=Agrilus planipennis TaxID=224129 RepID=A0A7F5RNT0_AGRPL|nr:uncharacterized protein LOC112906813 [Agrilus planipennis]